MVYYESNYLCHYGLKGMKWGIRRWQFTDGRFNDAGKARYFGQNSSHRRDSVKALQGDSPKSNRSSPASGSSSSDSGGRSFDKQKAKKIAKNVAIGAAVVAGTALVAYGGYKIHQAGGMSTISNKLKAKMRETMLADIKVKASQIKAEGKKKLAKKQSSNVESIKKVAKSSEKFSDDKSMPKVPKLTLDSNAVKVGAEFAEHIAKITSNFAEFKRMSEDQQAIVQRGENVIDNYTNDLLARNNKK